MRKFWSVLFALVLLAAMPGFSAAAEGTDPGSRTLYSGWWSPLLAGNVPASGGRVVYITDSGQWYEANVCQVNALGRPFKVFDGVAYPTAAEVASLPECNFTYRANPMQPSAPATTDPVTVNPQSPPPAEPANSGQGGFRPATPAPNVDNQTNCYPGEFVAPSEAVANPYKQSGDIGACDISVQVPDGYYMVLDAQIATVNGVGYAFPLNVYGPGTYQVWFRNGAMLVGSPELVRGRFQFLRDTEGPSQGIPYQVGGQVPAGW